MLLVVFALQRATAAKPHLSTCLLRPVMGCATPDAPYVLLAALTHALASCNMSCCPNMELVAIAQAIA